MFADNPEFIAAFTHKETGIIFYCPSETTTYHKSRELAMQAQEQYSRCGISKDVLKSFIENILDLCNKENNVARLRTDVGTYMNNLQARMKSPVDELCAIRMGAIACFIEGENPNEVKDSYTQQKLKLADRHPDIYAFFLNTGIAFTPEYNQVWRGLLAEDYFQTRKLMLSGLMPQ